MFERFTSEARRVVVLAQEEAVRLKHNYIGTEHLLLGILAAPESAAARAMRAVGMQLSKVRENVIEVIGEGDRVVPGGHIPFTPRAKKALELSLREALKLEHNEITSAHIALGLMSEGEGVGAQIIERSATDLDLLREQLLRAAGPRVPRQRRWRMRRGSRGLAEYQGYQGRVDPIEAALRDPESPEAKALVARGIDPGAVADALEAGKPPVPDARVAGDTTVVAEDDVVVIRIPDARLAELVVQRGGDPLPRLTIHTIFSALVEGLADPPER